MVRLQLHISEQQDKALRAAARRQGTSRAELIRTAIDAWLREPAGDRDSLLNLVGIAGPTGRKDASESIDTVLYGPLATRLPAAAEDDEA
jgi:Ribbon-helix-helix protein, copG family